MEEIDEIEPCKHIYFVSNAKKNFIYTMYVIFALFGLWIFIY